MTAVSIVAAISDNGVIGKEGGLPWRVPEDLAHFKSLTMGGTLIMGRKTYESIGRPLPGRTTIVITRRPDFAPTGVRVAHDPDSALAMADQREVFVVGGAEVYASFLPLASRLFLTRVHGTFAGDTVFPPFDRGDWRLVSTKPSTPTPGVPPCTFENWERQGDTPPFHR